MGQRRRKQHGDWVRRALRWTGYFWALAGVLVGMGASTCGWADSAIDRCSDSTECQHLPGTFCLDDMCVCATPEHEFCEGACRPMVECAWYTGAGGGGGSGGASDGECQTADECTQPGSPRCGQATCQSGVCGLSVKPLSKIASQVRGDCKNLWCDGAGNLVEFEDASDTYNDGSQCTFDFCQAGQPAVQNEANAITCRETQDGVCYDGDCVACIDGVSTCFPGFVCDGVRCVAAHCVNEQWDPGLGETAENCGGPCRPCATGLTCKIPADCRTGVCSGGVCQPPTDSDGVKNENETGVDCGGPASAPRCEAGQGCKVASDCLSGVCWTGLCEPPKCDDGIKNGDEEDWDCGGSCGPCK